MYDNRHTRVGNVASAENAIDNDIWMIPPFAIQIKIKNNLVKVILSIIGQPLYSNNNKYHEIIKNNTIKVGYSLTH